ncbi:HlyD family secretion protein [Cysteiniphilum sp. 6C5]|uniref:HlyD family secretion protein n=1 Tax=unclassified Cysteiniphilum TaxID=2610889 RepID=UPI003F8697DE
MPALFNLLKRSKVVISIVILLIIAYVGYFWVTCSTSTDNAYVVANVQPVATEVSGKVQDVYVSNNQMVQKGALLFSLDPKPYEIKRQEANLNLQALEVAYLAAKERLANYMQKDLLQQNASELQLLKTKVKATQIKVQQAQLAVDVAKSQLAATKVYAVENGIVSNLFLAKGTLVHAYQRLFSFIDTSQWWVQANFKETDLADVKKGDKATIRLRMYMGNKVYQGTVADTNWAVGRRAVDSADLLQSVPQENQWLLLPQRFPVMIKIDNPDPNFPLHVGASAYVKIEAAK